MKTDTMSISQPLDVCVDHEIESVRKTPDLHAAISRISKSLDNVDATSILDKYTLNASKELGADYFAIGRLNPFSNIMRTLRFVANGKIVDNIIYSLDGTPCADVINEGICVHKDNVIEEYPRDRELQDLNIVSYAGATLNAMEGEPIGIMTAMWRRPIQNETYVTELLCHFRNRISSVVETTEALKRYSWAIANVFSGVWDWDVRTGGATLSKELQQLICDGKRAKPCDLAQLEQAMHPDDRSKHVEALKRHINNGTPYDLKLRLRDQTGAYRWYVSRGRVTRDVNGKPERMIGGFCDIHDIIVGLEKTPRN